MMLSYKFVCNIIKYWKIKLQGKEALSLLVFAADTFGRQQHSVAALGQSYALNSLHRLNLQ